MSGILAHISRLWCVKCKGKLQQSDAEMTMNVWGNCGNSDLTAEIPFTQGTHHALLYTHFYINFIYFFPACDTGYWPSAFVQADNKGQVKYRYKWLISTTYAHCPIVNSAKHVILWHDRYGLFDMITLKVKCFSAQCCAALNSHLNACFVSWRPQPLPLEAETLSSFTSCFIFLFSFDPFSWNFQFSVNGRTNFKH